MQVETGISGTLRANEHRHNPIVFTKQSFSKYSKNEIASTVLNSWSKGADKNDLVIDTGGGLLRRITPREAERLQGFPDDWTKIPYKGKPPEKCPDGLRYKAIGNSMAVPVMRWLGRRIMLAERIFGEKQMNIDKEG
jgi:DNA (cytosine-5)-methyltransferase 1